jgi:hypothetical protein
MNIFSISSSILVDGYIQREAEAIVTLPTVLAVSLKARP